ncbi:hypothetical protein KPL71_015390 [Citrus sinensis]|uniref:Uncharacterized protein n=1 Tax=Citrus sinensis TaxID=2711 RepID=A0ACB8KIL4_CITSI|nr:hypothetical protein KPL71_015390 [Citrus sinensis]
MRSLALSSSLPRICLGDFNDLLHPSEKCGKHVHPNWKLHGFQEVFLDSGLFDLGIIDYQFTWERSRGTENWVEERLDRALASNSWIHFFPRAKVISLEASCSDHLPIFLDPAPVNKLASCAFDLLQWGSHLMSDFRACILEGKKKMASLQGMHDPASVDGFIKARKRHNELLQSHEIFWKQRAKSIWLKEGDINSRYFHIMASTRKKKNVIGKFQNTQGQWCTTPEENNESQGLRLSRTTLETFSPADVHDAIFSMHPDKSPRLDAKAYDRIEWNFLSSMLKMGFDYGFVNLIMLCVTTVTYKISRDGMEGDLIVPSRGLRQGDPLSPYLFIYVLKV